MAERVDRRERAAALVVRRRADELRRAPAASATWTACFEAELRERLGLARLARRSRRARGAAPPAPCRTARGRSAIELIRVPT